MSIEKNIERIADALEALVAGQSAAPAENPAEKSAKSAEKKKPAAKSKAKAEPKGDAPGKDEVREALKDYQKRESPTAARELIREHGNGASSITALDEDDYQAVIDACAE